jgi:hypothetical protein
VGAIRWDAWYTPGFQVISASERTLSHSNIVGACHSSQSRTMRDTLVCPPITQGLMDLEIAQAVYAGLDYLPHSLWISSAANE